MQVISDTGNADFSSIIVDPFWNTGEEKEMRMHKIHSYPAKFPAFLTSKALQYVYSNGAQPKIIADIFCGCGTVALEANRSNIDFWGCDLNPVATLIAKAKSKNYNAQKTRQYAKNILELFSKISCSRKEYNRANERLKYWYKEKQYLDLFRLKQSILRTVPPQSKYRNLFLCAFSNILKPTSVWLTKSIKPQVDPTKKPSDVISKFEDQCGFIIGAISENKIHFSSKTKISTADCLSSKTSPPMVDLIVTSPPYVTSYEYADLHQLSSLWLDFAEDYRELRNGSIGSGHHAYNFNREAKRLNSSATEMVFRLHSKDKRKSRSVAKYFLDMQGVAKVCFNMLEADGYAFFVIGNTEYKGVRIDNARHLVESLYQSGFSTVSATKRKIIGKTLTPYRTKSGRFTSDSKGRKVYSEEFIIVVKR